MTEVLSALSLATIAAVLVVLLVIVIPAVRQVQRTAARVEILAVRFQEELDPIVLEARRTLGEMRRGAATVEALTGRIDQVIRLLDQTSLVLTGLRAALGKAVSPPLTVATSAVEGIRQALHYLFKEQKPDRDPQREEA